MEDSMMLGSAAAMTGIVATISLLIAMIAMYIATSYGIYLLAKKYEPTLHPALSWIPVVNVFIYAKLSGKSLWWLLGLFVPFLNIFVTFYYAYWISKRTGNDVGMMFLLVIFPCIALPWLGLRAFNRKTTTAWVLGVLSILGGIIGFITLIITVSMGAASMANNPEFQSGLQDAMEEFKDSPEFQQAMEEIQNNPEFQAQMEKNPETRAQIEAMINTDATTN